MKVRAIWEFDADVSDIDPKQVDIQGLAKDLAQQEMSHLIWMNQITAADFVYEVGEPEEVVVKKISVALELTPEILASIKYHIDDESKRALMNELKLAKEEQP